VKKKRNKWITLNNENIFILEEAYKKDPNSVIEKGKLKVERIVQQTVNLPNKLIKYAKKIISISNPLWQENFS